VQSLIDGAALDADGERDFAFGEIINSLTPEQRATLDSGPRNLGHLVSASKRPGHAGPPAHAGPPGDD
jgi:hypothetical protein